MPVPAPPARAVPPSKALVTLWLLPLLVYAGVMVASVLRRGPLHFGADDLGLLLLALAYCCVGAYLAAGRGAAYLGRFVACSYSLLIVCALGEGFLRWARPSLENIPSPPMHSVYTPSANMPGISGPVEYTINRMGVRGPDMRLEDADLRILCVGGSTTQCLYVTDKQTWPWLVQDRLAQQLGKRVFVANTGQAGHIALNHDYLLNKYPLAKRFDWVIVFCGWNDMAAHLCLRNYETRKALVDSVTLQNRATDRHRAYYGDLALVHWLGEIGRKPVGKTQDTGGQWMDNARRERQTALKARTIREVPREELRQALVLYRENLNQIINTCRKNNQHLVLMTQPTIYRADLPEELERLTWLTGENEAYTSAVLAEMMDAFNQALIAVCKERGVDYIDLASLLPKDTTVVYDDCHLNNAGCEKVASAVEKFLLGKLQAGK
jgi:lysophospholipase L1-like esterase